VPYHRRDTRTEIDYAGPGTHVEVLPGVIAKRQFTYTADFYESDAPTVTLTVAVGEHGFECRGIELKSNQDITAATLRAIPLAHLVRDASTHALQSGYIDDDGTPKFPTNPFDVSQEKRAAVGKRARRPRGHRLTDDELRQVAQTYREALKARDRAPTDHVAKEHAVSRTTASRWIRLARDAGYLGPAIPYRAGEAATDVVA
jgi:hypothetical protein